MQVYHSLSEAKSLSLPPAAVAIGNFDGCHLGHRKILRTLRKYAASKDLIPTVLTFFPHPAQVLKSNEPSFRLFTLSEKLACFEEMGVASVFVAPFDRSVIELTPNEFINHYLIEALSCEAIFVGNDFHYGKNRSGNIETLKHLRDTRKIHLHVEEEYKLDGLRVSSSQIRELLKTGLIEQANRFLGSSYSIEGKVKTGDGRGRKLGFPTLNLDYPSEKLTPSTGVYVTLTIYDEDIFPSITNVGYRPTFDQASKTPQIETHLLDTEKSLYGETVRIEFLHRVRSEISFPSADDLKAQISKDLVYAKNFFKTKE